MSPLPHQGGQGPLKEHEGCPMGTGFDSSVILEGIRVTGGDLDLMAPQILRA